jgi:ribosomal protein S27AE
MRLDYRLGDNNVSINGVSRELTEDLAAAIFSEVAAQIARVENRIDVPFAKLTALPEQNSDDGGIDMVRTDYACPKCGAPTYMIFERADSLYSEPLDKGMVPDPRPCQKCEKGETA